MGLDSDFTDSVAGAFARYPYAESFFVSGEAPNLEHFTFFNRTGRPPAWLHDPGRSVLFPVVAVTNPTVTDVLIQRIRPDVLNGRRFSVFDVTIGATPYQVVARLTYRDAYRSELASVFGFMADLAWVRAHYFHEVAAQVSRIGDSGIFATRILDDRGDPIVGAAHATDAGPLSRRSLPVLFFDPLLVAVNPSNEPTRASLTVEVSAARIPACGRRTGPRCLRWLWRRLPASH